MKKTTKAKSKKAVKRPGQQKDAEREYAVPAETSANWSRPEDRGEDLAEERDPFMQQPERDTQTPPEMIQKEAYRLYEQRGGAHGDDLADWFAAESRCRHGSASSR